MMPATGCCSVAKIKKFLDGALMFIDVDKVGYRAASGLESDRLAA
jgi:hypothetical protein